MERVLRIIEYGCYPRTWEAGSGFCSKPSWKRFCLNSLNYAVILSNLFMVLKNLLLVLLIPIFCYKTFYILLPYILLKNLYWLCYLFTFQMFFPFLVFPPQIPYAIPSSCFYEGASPPTYPLLLHHPYTSRLHRTKGLPSQWCQIRPFSATYAAGAMGPSICTVWLMV